MEQLEQLISVATTAERLGVSHAAVRDLIRAGELVGYRIGSLFRVDAPSIDAYLERARVKTGPR